MQQHSDIFKRDLIVQKCPNCFGATVYWPTTRGDMNNVWLYAMHCQINMNLDISLVVICITGIV